jgi:hypothetical protein
MPYKDEPTDPYMQLIGKVTLFIFNRFVDFAASEQNFTDFSLTMSTATMDYIKNTLKVENPFVAFMVAIAATDEAKKIITRRAEFAMTN